jgi:pimeloyl-ACP methyl ester carboxylesterase
MAPFRNWKYGRILFQALVPALQKRLVRRFVSDVRQGSSELAGVLRPGPPPPPDVIAHSFGTWILANALQSHDSLRVGHVILVSSIVPPDWNWSRIFERGQVSGILNYCADRDPWVRAAERFIPSSGPSGSRGFLGHDQRLLNVLRPGGTHSSAFATSQLQSTFEEVWRPFLSDRADEMDLGKHRILQAQQWKPAKVFLRAPTSLAALALIVSGLGILAAFFVS